MIIYFLILFLAIFFWNLSYVYVNHFREKTGYWIKMSDLFFKLTVLIIVVGIILSILKH